MIIPQIADQEFADRRAAALRRAKDDGFDGLLVWSRGGHTVEAYGDVFYLTNFHSLFPVQPDRCSWASRGHAALILPIAGDPVIITDYLDDPEDRIKISDVRSVADITVSTTEALREKGLLGKRIGLVGGNSFLVSAERRMRTAPGGELLNLIPADYILEDLRVIQSEAELNMMRHAAGVGVMWMNATFGALQEGRTEGDAVGEGLRVLAANGGVQQDIAISSGPNSEHYFGSSGVPHWNITRPLQKGDLVHVDQWGPVHAYYTDFARSMVVGGKPSDAQREVLEGAISVIEHVIEGIKPGRTLGDLFDRGATWLERNGFPGPRSGPNGSPRNNFSVQFPSFGHSLGLGIDVPNIAENEPAIIRPNMVLAIEALVSQPGVGAANFEQNVIVHPDRVEILTEGCQKRWW